MDGPVATQDKNRIGLLERRVFFGGNGQFDAGNAKRLQPLLFRVPPEDRRDSHPGPRLADFVGLYASGTQHYLDRNGQRGGQAELFRGRLPHAEQCHSTKFSAKNGK